MTSLLRQIVAGPRAKHAETGLDLCYVTDNIIATSGPSQTYPQRAYRNPLDRLVAFLDAKHGENWAIWEFRAEGTGYPDEAVYGRIRHYPWPDHHPPPFRLVPMIMASMRNWLGGGELDGGVVTEEKDGHATKQDGEADKDKDKNWKERLKAVAGVDSGKRVVVVHCKAGKGRSGSMATSYLISECGWSPEDALARFTERRMRPKFGAGVSIPSQLRWISYVDRWTRGGKKYVDREIEILEVHAWGLRHGVKVSVEGFVDEGKKIKVFHTFRKEERLIIEGEAPGGGGMMDFLGDALSPTKDDDEIVEEADFGQITDTGGSGASSPKSTTSLPARSKSKSLKGSRTSLIRRASKSGSSSSLKKLGDRKSKTIDAADAATSSPSSATSSPPDASNLSLSDPKTQSQSSLSHSATFADQNEPGGMAVIFKPEQPIRTPNSDINICVERRNRARASMGLTMVTAVAHVWFNTYFEGNGPEQDGKADDSGVFEIEWERMDGIKGSSRKGTRAADRISIVWRAVGAGEKGVEGAAVEDGKVVITEPGEGEPVPQMQAADWKGNNEEDPEAQKHLGLRTEDPESASVSKASSIKSQDAGQSEEEARDDDSMKGVKTSGPSGEEVVEDVQGSKGRAASDHQLKVEATQGSTDDPEAAARGRTL